MKRLAALALIAFCGCSEDRPNATWACDSTPCRAVLEPVCALPHADSTPSEGRTYPNLCAACAEPAVKAVIRGDCKGFFNPVVVR
jgi:hypothetical protein